MKHLIPSEKVLHIKKAKHDFNRQHLKRTCGDIFSL